jgi:hypothetical protein
MKKIFVLTRAINQYDQEGDYLVAVFKKLPTEHELINLIGCNKEYARHILNTGGRKDNEYEWFYLTPLDFGSKYQEQDDY